MITSFARVRTEHAKAYLGLIVGISQRGGSAHCDDDAHASLELRSGHCELAADDLFLDVSITANSVFDAVMLEDIVSDRLDDVATGEELRYQWIMAPDRHPEIKARTK